MRIAALTVALVWATAVEADYCDDTCKAILPGLSHKAVCQPYRRILPKPKVMVFCQDGFKSAHDKNCRDICLNKSEAHLREMYLDESCSHALGQSPRPSCHDACMKGYNAGYEATQEALQMKLQELTEEQRRYMLEETDVDVPVPEEHHNAALRAAAAEEDAKIAAAEAAARKLVERHLQGAIPEKDESYDKDELENIEPITSEVMDGRNLEEAEQEEETQQLHEPEAEEGNTRNLAQDENNMEVAEDVEADEVPEDMTAQGDEGRRVLLSLPITVDDRERHLTIYEGEDAMAAVHSFCAEHMPDEGENCMDELRSVVEDHIDV